MAQNMQLGMYKSLNALPKVFELGGQKRYLFFLSSFKPFCLDKHYPKLIEDYTEKKLDNKSLFWIATELHNGAEKPAVKWVHEVTGKMIKKIEADDKEGFWELFPELKQHIELFLIDYYKLFPDKKPVDEPAPKPAEAPKEELKPPPPPKKKAFFSAFDEEDDVIKEIKRQKAENKGKVVVSARKLAEEAAKEDNEDTNYAAKLAKFENALAKKKEEKEIDDKMIFNNVMNLAKANDEVGQNPNFNSVKREKIVSLEAPGRIGKPDVGNSPSIDFRKDPQIDLLRSKSDHPGSLIPRQPSKEEPSKLKSPEPPQNIVRNSPVTKDPPLKSPPIEPVKKVEEEKEKINLKKSPVGPGVSKPKMMLMNKNKKSPNLQNKNRPNGNIKFGGNKKNIQIKQGGMKGKSQHMFRDDSDDENDYPFDDGIKCAIF